MRRLSVVMAALAATASYSFQATANTAYTQRRDDQRAEHVKALAKKQRVREQIRARRNVLRGKT